MWILILTLTAPGYSSVQVAITSVNGFTTEKACINAGDKYLSSGQAPRKAQFICVKA